jgi:rare lipoprotein A (peptidoglycan hydrolase)
VLAACATAPPPPARTGSAWPQPEAATPVSTRTVSKSQPLDDKMKQHGFDPRRYYETRALYKIEGVASYYGDEFAGRRTANGERYDPNAYTAAHRTLPFGTIVRVTRRTTGDWVLVRINDRGPFGKKKRILDLSKQAARRLGMIHDGVAKIRVEVLEEGDNKYKRR